MLRTLLLYLTDMLRDVTELTFSKRSWKTLIKVPLSPICILIHHYNCEYYLYTYGNYHFIYSIDICLCNMRHFIYDSHIFQIIYDLTKVYDFLNAARDLKEINWNSFDSHLKIEIFTVLTYIHRGYSIWSRRVEGGGGIK